MHNRLTCETRVPFAFLSSNLTELHTNVDTFTDCLFLLDGRFKQLHTLFINVQLFLLPSPMSFNQEELIHLKCFSLTCVFDVSFYKEVVILILQRMSNLEELFLNLSIERHILGGSFIDGNNLKNDMINHMPKINKFLFSIHSNIKHDHYPIDLPSNEDIQRTFIGLEKYQIVSYMDYFPKSKISQCHIYLYPYRMKHLLRLTNSFPGGLFEFVQKVSLIDEHPFEHEFFIRIGQSFPYLKTLIIENISPQNHKQSQQLNENNRSLEIIKYPCLTLLYLFHAHDDYLEEFLDDKKTCLSKLVILHTKYSSLKTITNNFTKDSTRLNCAKIIPKYIIHVDRHFPPHYHLYFPHTNKL